jgi:large-conductance mechanosensitive channel
MATQSTTGMGMHMNTYYNNSVYVYGNIINFVILMLIVLLVIMMIFKLLNPSGAKKCNKCGMNIESNEWKICPRCGNPLDEGRVK